jgi:hypothetical protein
MLSVVYVNFSKAECLYAKCRGAHFLPILSKKNQVKYFLLQIFNQPFRISSICLVLKSVECHGNKIIMTLVQ